MGARNFTWRGLEFVETSYRHWTSASSRITVRAMGDWYAVYTPVGREAYTGDSPQDVLDTLVAHTWAKYELITSLNLEHEGAS